MATCVPRKGPGGRQVWQALVRRKGWPQQIRIFDTKAAADTWARQIETEMDRGVCFARRGLQHDLGGDLESVTCARSSSREAGLTSARQLPKFRIRA